MWWIVVLGVLAVGLTAALIWDRRRDLREGRGGSPDQWKVEREQPFSSPGGGGGSGGSFG